jgi:hypothetical protein
MTLRKYQLIRKEKLRPNADSARLSYQQVTLPLPHCLSGTEEKAFPAQACFQNCIARSPGQGRGPPRLRQQVALTGASTVRHPSALGTWHTPLPFSRNNGSIDSLTESMTAD